MDHALIRFRKAAAKENRDRRTVRRRYSRTLQQHAVEYLRARQQQGDGLRDVAESLGVAPWSLHRWARASETHGGFHPVQIAEDPPAITDAGLVVVMHPDGLRVEGLDVTAAAQLLRLLR